MAVIVTVLDSSCLNASVSMITLGFNAARVRKIGPAASVVLYRHWPRAQLVAHLLIARTTPEHDAPWTGASAHAIDADAPWTGAAAYAIDAVHKTSGARTQA